MFRKLGSWCHDHRRAVVVLWVVALLAIGLLSRTAGSNFTNTLSLPSSESAKGFALLDSEFGGRGLSSSATLVFSTDAGVTDPTVQAEMQAYFDRITAETGVQVVSPYGPQGATQISALGDRAGKVAFARLEIPDGSMGEQRDLGQKIESLAPTVDGLRIEYGGNAFETFKPPSSEVLGLAFAMVILILAFGSVLAMGLPIGVALAGIGIGSALIALLSHLLSMPDFATTLGVMIGLGVGIDYALFIVTRYREQLRDGHDVRESIAIALDTVGPGGRLRRAHRGDLAAGHAPHGHRTGEGPRHRRRGRGGRHHGGVTHTAPRAARLRRAPGRRHPLAGPDRRRPRRRRPRGRRPQVPAPAASASRSPSCWWSPASPSPRCARRCPAGHPSRPATPSPTAGAA